jgi:uncharacterized alpha-E superfamily protein
VALLARVADRIYWGARYGERAEDTARIIRAFSDLLIDLPTELPLRWEPLVAIAGSGPLYHEHNGDDAGEDAVMRFLIADTANPASIASSVAWSRENMRTTREVLPREAWQALNGLHQYVSSEADRAVNRRARDRFLGRVIDDNRRMDGTIESTMTRANPYRLWRLGRLIERADMTTRVLGVRAASILQLRALDLHDDHDEVQWMGVLRSISALQMYQRATHGPIEGPSVVRFLLYYSRFPRSVQGCLDTMRAVLADLPRPEPVLAALDDADAVLASCGPAADDGAALDDAMDHVQVALAALDRAITDRYFSTAAVPGTAPVSGGAPGANGGESRNVQRQEQRTPDPDGVASRSGRPITT